jgi:uncharacterized repeat protein (TIGR02059 family)
VVAQALRFKQFGWNAPRVNPFGAGVNGAALTIPFSPASTGQDPPIPGAVTPAQFTVLVNGVSRAVNAANVAGVVLTLTLAAAVTNGQTVTVQYVGGGANPLKDAQGDLVAPFSMSVKNNTP